VTASGTESGIQSYFIGRMSNEDLHNLYTSETLLGDQIIDDEMGGHVEYMEEMRNVYKILVGKPERKRTQKT
jgi:hypothetical protein